MALVVSAVVSLLSSSRLQMVPPRLSRSSTVFWSTTDRSRYVFRLPLFSNKYSRNVQVEVLVASADLIPQPKTLGQRITQPKAQPKSAAQDKHKDTAKAGAGAKAGNKKPRKGRNSRPAKKTAEELDSDMADYFVKAPATGEATNGAAPAAANGDAAMEDDIM